MIQDFESSNLFDSRNILAIDEEEKLCGWKSQNKNTLTVGEKE